MRHAIQIGLFVVASLAPAPSASAQIVEPPFDAYYQLQVIGHPPLPNDLGGLAIRPTDPNRLLITSFAQTAQAAVWSVGVIRDADGHIVALDDEPPQFEFTGGGAEGGIYGSLVVMPNGAILFPTGGTNQIGEVLPGQSAPGLLIPVQPYGIANYPSGLLLVPAHWCGAGTITLLTADTLAGGQHQTFVNLVPTVSGYWLIDDGEPASSYPFTTAGVAAIPDNCATAELGRMVVTCENFAGQVTVVTPNGSPTSGGLLDWQSRRILVNQILGPRGVTVDPVTKDLILVDRDPAIPQFADRIIAIRFLGGCSCAADIDRNGRVAGLDLAIVLNEWGSECVEAGADINGDGGVNADDLAEVLANWGPCPG
jgi:hypothetical protein